MIMSEAFLVDVSIVMFNVCLCYAFLSVPCSPVITCRERADLLALLRMIDSCVYVTFPYGAMGPYLYQLLIFAFFFIL